MPIRHGKSEYLANHLIAWYLMMFPGNSVLFATATKELAVSFSAKAATTLTHWAELLTGASVAYSRQSYLQMNEGGSLYVRTPTGSCVGIGADLLIADDLITKQEDVLNPAQRDKIWRFFHADFLARAHPNAKVIQILSRRHPDDLSGRCLDSNERVPQSKKWQHLRLPAISDANEALWPERWPLEELEAIRDEKISEGQAYLWHCLYQNDPVTDNHLLEWPDSFWQDIYFTSLPPDLPIKYRLLSLDPSKGATSRPGDFAGIMDVLVDTTNTLWVFPHILRLESSALEDYVTNLIEKNTYNAIIAEVNGFQESLVNNIVIKCRNRNLNCPMNKINSTDNKRVRILLDLTPFFSAKKLRINQSSPYAKLLLSQLKEFGSGKGHDDGPDALSLIVKLLFRLLPTKSSAPKRLAV